MQNEPDSNLDPNADRPKRETDDRHLSVGGDYISVSGGDIGPGVSIGRGTVQADYIVAGDLTFASPQPREPKQEEFAELLIRLRDLIVEAERSGEINDKIAKKTLTSLAETANMVTKEEKPPKNQIVRKLQYIADVLEAAVDMFSADGGAAKILLKALPIAALLIKIASRIF